MKVNLTPPVEDAALTDAFFWKAFNCLEYGKRSHCLTDMVVMD